MRSLLAVADRLERGVIGLLAAAALLLACNAIVARHLAPGLTLDWTFEVITFLVIWAVFLSTGRLISVGGHIRIDLILRALTPAGRRWFGILASLLGLAVTILLLWSGVLVVEEAMRWGETTASTLHVPLWIYYLSLPTGATLMALRLVWRIVGLVTGSQIEEASSGEAH